jgi:hypothetical protein
MPVVTAAAKQISGDIVKATDIITLLAIKHAEDVFIPECKDGPTHYGQHLRMDAWAMRKSWSKPLSIVYEVKVSRSDFLKDDKWRFYLPYCNEFYFVSPAGLIMPEECPPEAGLMCVSKTGSKIFIKKKPIYRDVEIPETLYRYVLMSRAKIQREYIDAGGVNFWIKWLEDEKTLKDIGYKVSRRIVQIVEKARQEARDATELVKKYEEIKNRITELGFDPNKHIRTWEITRALDELCGVIPVGFRRDLEQLKDRVGDVLEELDTLEKRRTAASVDGI